MARNSPNTCLVCMGLGLCTALVHLRGELRHQMTTCIIHAGIMARNSPNTCLVCMGLDLCTALVHIRGERRQHMTTL